VRDRRDRCRRVRTTIIDNGDLYNSRVFPTPELARQEAAEKKAALLAAGRLERLPMPD
jgi:hypothetical protein